MKKIFLTSGLVMCMACPAFATNVSGTGNECTVDVLGVSNQGDTANIDATWTPKQYTIAYAAGGGTGQTASQTVTFDSKNYSLATNTFTKTGYHFTGWRSPVNLVNGEAPVSPATYIEYAGTPTQTTNGNYTPATVASYGYAAADPDRTVTLTAQWAPNTYGVTYYPGTAKVGEISHAVNGNAYTDATSATYDSPYTVLDNANANLSFSQTGYNFAGWRANYNIATNTATALTDSNTAGGTQYAAGATPTYLTTDSVNMYAQWTPKSYTISYGSGAHGSVPNNGTDPVQYANGLTYDTAWTTKTFAETGIEADTGYTFAGWNTAADGQGGTAYAEDAAQSAWQQDNGLTLYAIYTANTTTITYNCGVSRSNPAVSGTWTAPSGWNDGNTQTATYDAVLTHPTGSDVCTLAGYTFASWECKNGNTVLDNAGLGTGADATKWKTDVAAVTCTAQWTPNRINITWDLDEGQADTAGGQTCDYDGAVTVPTNPHKTGYTFGGWNVVTPAQQGD